MRSRFALALILAVFGTASAQAQVRDTAVAPRSPAEQTYFEFQVEKPVRHAPGSAFPRYPPELKAAGVDGEVLAQFVVDTLGMAVLQTFKVLKSTHGRFTEAIKAALPGMKFVPAELRGQKVRQLVQQPFVFAVQKTDSSATTAGAVRAPGPPPVIPPVSITPAPSSGTVRGWSMAQRLTVDSGNGTPAISISMRRYGAAGRTRLEMEVPARLSMGMGARVTLTDSSTGRTTVLMPTRTMATVTKTQPRASAPFTAKFRPSSHGITDLGEGETIAGLPTRHYRVMGTTESRFNLGAQTCVVTQETVTEYWATKNPMFLSILRQSRGSGTAVSEPSAIPMPEADSLELSKLGAFLKVVAHNSGPVSIRNGVLTVTSEVLSFSDSLLEASLFEVPEGYQLHDLTAVGPPPVRSDSLRAVMTKQLFEQWVDTTKVVPGVSTTCTASPAHTTASRR